MGAADTYTTDEDTQLQVDAPGVLANDGAGLDTCVIGTDVTGLQGNVTMDADGSFTYAPPADFHGETTFAYRIATSGRAPSRWPTARPR